jgi:hypothetical protein
MIFYSDFPNEVQERVTIFATDQQAAAAQAKKQLNLQQQVQEALR